MFSLVAIIQNRNYHVVGNYSSILETIHIFESLKFYYKVGDVSIGNFITQQELKFDNFIYWLHPENEFERNQMSYEQH